MTIAKDESRYPDDLGDPIEPKMGLLAGLYIMVAASSSGKSLCSLSMCEESEIPAAYLCVNESHGVQLPVSWLLTALDLGPLDMPISVMHSSVRTLSFPKTRVIAIDSFTYWCWTAERLEQTLTADVPVSSTSKRAVASSLRRSAAKAGGVTGELQEFLLMVDDATRSRNQVLIATINSDQYPIAGGGAKMYSLFKGVVTGVLTPHMRKGGDSSVSISDRGDRTEREYFFNKDSVKKAATILFGDDTEEATEEAADTEKIEWVKFSRS